MYLREVLCTVCAVVKDQKVIELRLEPSAARPSKFYLDGILEGCKDNQIPTESVMEAVKRTRQEVKKEKNRYAR